MSEEVECINMIAPDFVPKTQDLTNAVDFGSSWTDEEGQFIIFDNRDAHVLFYLEEFNVTACDAELAAFEPYSIDSYLHLFHLS